MKIGLLTFHRSDNIGAVLQAYALQTALVRMGLECEFVDLPVAKHPDRADLYSSNMLNAEAFVKKVAAEGSRRKQMFEDFRTRYLNISRFHKDLSDVNEQYDLFIAGSDQIWNFTLEDTADYYFLPFADDKKRFSYAASFGGDSVPENKKSFVSEQLAGFQKISVREETGKQIVSELAGREAVVCADPVFLLTDEEWKVITGTKATDEQYVFVYMVQYSAQIAEEAKTYALEHNCAVKTMTSSFMLQAGFEAWSSFGVQDFLKFVRGARKVFTNSFHGTAFSIIFGKEFEVYPLTGSLKARNARVAELLARRDNLEAERTESLKYLKDITNTSI